MAIPDYQSIMLPLLKYLGDGEEHTVHKAATALADEFGLSDEERSAPIASGQQSVLVNRVGWARTYLKKAGLVASPRRGVQCSTPRGLSVLNESPAILNNAYLLRYPEFAQFLKARTETLNPVPVADEGSQTTPQESIELGYLQLRREVESEVLDRVKQCTPQFFERLVVELLVRMGYGGSLRDAGNAVGRSGDEGIDGIIKEDKLGLDTVYIQAKRWNGVTVGRPEIQRFVGALVGQRARKGVFITTSTFSADARAYVSGIESKVVLIDGAELAALMVDYNVGVTVVTTYDVKRIDSDYFLEE